RLFLSSRRRHTRFSRDWSSDMCSSDLTRINRNVSMATRKPKGLGRGLDALLGADAGAIATIGKTAAAPEKDGLPSTLPVKLLKRSEERRVGKECGAWWADGCEERQRGE